MNAIAAFLIGLAIVPIWAYLTGLFGIIILWILAFMGHFLGLGALFTNFHWWTVLRWGYAFTALEVLMMSAGSSGSGSGGSAVDTSVFWGIGSALVASFIGIAVLRHRHLNAPAFR